MTPAYISAANHCRAFIRRCLGFSVDSRVVCLAKLTLAAVILIAPTALNWDLGRGAVILAAQGSNAIGVRQKRLGTSAHSLRGEQTRSVMPRDQIRVVGRVIVNDRPLSDGAILFARSGSVGVSGQSVARIRHDGTYALTLPAIDAYDVTFKASGFVLLGQRRLVDHLVNGDNHRDFELIGGTLTINLPNWDGREPVAVRLSRSDQTQPGLSAVGRVVLDPLSLPIVIEGVALESFTVEAHEQPREVGRVPRKSSVHPVALSSHQRSDSVALVLREYRGRLTLLDTSSRPVTGASVSGDGVPMVPEISPGTYSLASLSPGSRLLIRAEGYPPVCAHAPESNAAEIILDLGIQVDFVFDGSMYADLSRPAGRLVWPRTECPIALDRFAYSEIAAGSNVRFRITNFPASPDVKYLYGGFDPLQTAVPLDVSRGIVTISSRR